MSADSLTVTPELFAYIAARASAEDALLRELVIAAEAAGLPKIHIAPEQGALLSALIRALGAREVVEVGTLGGYSGIVIARALASGGRLRTIELEPRHADFAESWFARAGLAARVQVMRGTGRERLSEIAAGSIDAIFVDADKASYSAYVDQAARLLRPGGLLLIDNAFAFGRVLDASDRDPDVLAIRAANDALAADRRFAGVIVPLGDGMWVATRL